MFRYNRISVRELSSDIYRNIKQVENALKANEKFVGINQISMLHLSLLVWNDYEWKVNYGWPNLGIPKFNQ